VRRIHVVGVELGMARESHYKAEFKFLRDWLFSNVRIDNSGILARRLFRETADATSEIIKRGARHTGPQSHQHDVDKHRSPLSLRVLLPAS
jgi:hypothetical protein